MSKEKLGAKWAIFFYLKSSHKVPVAYPGGGDGVPPYKRVSLPPPPPPNLKVWIRHWVQIVVSSSTGIFWAGRG